MMNIPMLFCSWLGRTSQAEESADGFDDDKRYEMILEEIRNYLRREKQEWPESLGVARRRVKRDDTSSTCLEVDNDSLEWIRNSNFAGHDISDSSLEDFIYDLPLVPFVTLPINLEHSENSEDDIESTEDLAYLLPSEKAVEEAVPTLIDILKRTIGQSCATRVHSIGSILNEASLDLADIHSSSEIQDEENDEIYQESCHVEALPPIVPVPALICFEPGRSLSAEELERSSSWSAILDPVLPLVHGLLDDPDLAHLTTEMQSLLCVHLETNVLHEHACTHALTQHMRKHPAVCQVSYQLPEFDGPCTPLAYFSATSTLLGCSVAYESYPEAIGMEDHWVGLPLHYACYLQASLATIRFLVDRYPESTRRTNREHQTPLHMLCQNPCSYETLQYLLDHCPAAAQVADNSGYTPLHHACRSGCSLETIQALLDQSPSLIRSTTKAWLKPLHLACRHGSSLDVVRWLIACYPPAVEATTESFEAPIHLAVEGRACVETIRILVEACPKALGWANDSEETPLDVARRCSAPSEVLDLLVQRKQ